MTRREVGIVFWAFLSVWILVTAASILFNPVFLSVYSSRGGGGPGALASASVLLHALVLTVLAVFFLARREMLSEWLFRGSPESDAPARDEILPRDLAALGAAWLGIESLLYSFNTLQFVLGLPLAMKLADELGQSLPVSAYFAPLVFAMLVAFGAYFFIRREAVSEWILGPGSGGTVVTELGPILLGVMGIWLMAKGGMALVQGFANFLRIEKSVIARDVSFSFTEPPLIVEFLAGPLLTIFLGIVVFATRRMTGDAFWRKIRPLSEAAD
jgi:hypothetical protein